MIILSVLGLAVTLFFVYTMVYPVKYAVKREALEGKDYLICVQEYVTGFEWSAVESSYGYEGFMKLEGKLPLEEYRNFYPRVRFNKFICYGEFTGEGDFYGYEYKEFRVDEWDVLYPITRDSMMPDWMLPKGWFVPLDTID